MTTGRILIDPAELTAAATEARVRGLPPATDYRKHWDNLLALDTISMTQGPIADLGCRSGILLTWLHHVGRSSLYGCDVRRPWPPAKQALRQGQLGTAIAAARMYGANRRNMRRARAEKTGFPAGEFGAIAAMSVIEHHLDTAAFFREACRLLRPGGLLFVSTDYWPSGGATADGVVFSHDDVERLVREAADAGLVPGETPDLAAPDEPVVESYTFLTLSFEKPECLE